MNNASTILQLAYEAKRKAWRLAVGLSNQKLGRGDTSKVKGLPGK